MGKLLMEPAYLYIHEKWTLTMFFVAIFLHRISDTYEHYSISGSESVIVWSDWRYGKAENKITCL